METGLRVERKRPLVVFLLALVDILGGLLRLLLGLLFSALIIDPRTRVLGYLLGAIFVIPGVLHIVAAVGILRLRPWGRGLQIAVAILSLINFPLGTIVGTMTLVYLFQPAVRTLFSDRPVATLSPEERGHLVQVANLGSVAAIVLLCVLGVGSFFWLAMVSAIAVPNMLTAMERAKQKRTMADLRSIGVALQAYGEENDVYPEADDLAGLERALVPKYVPRLPHLDGWEHPLIATSTPEGYRLESLGKGGTDEPDRAGEQESFEADLVLVNGKFTQYPHGMELP